MIAQAAFSDVHCLSEVLGTKYSLAELRYSVQKRDPDGSTPGANVVLRSRPVSIPQGCQVIRQQFKGEQSRQLSHFIQSNALNISHFKKENILTTQELFIITYKH